MRYYIKTHHWRYMASAWQIMNDRSDFRTKSLVNKEVAIRFRSNYNPEKISSLLYWKIPFLSNSPDHFTSFWPNPFFTITNWIAADKFHLLFGNSRTPERWQGSTDVYKSKSMQNLKPKTNKAVYTTAPVAGGWAGAVMSWAGAEMIWAGA